MLIDSHCHLDRLDLSPYGNKFSNFMQDVESHRIEHLLCIAIDLEAYPAMRALVSDYSQISVTVGVHPNENCELDPSIEELIALGQDEKVIAIGETGLDYFRSSGDLQWQKQRFSTHIEAAKVLQKPLIIHSRDAGQDTLALLKAHDAQQVGGIIHCFTEDWDFACQALDLGFYISFSGIVTFNSAKQIQDVAKKLPQDRLLIETDSPYLAPMPFRGKPNYPTYVSYVAKHIAQLRATTLEVIAEQSTHNFYSLFKQVHQHS